jgi:hypothetical protein
MFMADPSLNEALTRANADLHELAKVANQLRAVRDEAQVAADEADEAVRVQTALVDSLRAAIQRYGTGPTDSDTIVAPPAPEPTNPHLLQSIPRTDAIVWALKQIGVPVGPSNITRWLNEHGRDDLPGAVGATLGHLQAQGRVRSQGYGQWVAVVPMEDAPGQ